MTKDEGVGYLRLSSFVLLSAPYFCERKIIHFGHYQVGGALIQLGENQVHFITGARV